MLHHGFDKIKGLPYFSYGKKGKRFHYHVGNVAAMHAAKAKAMKHAHSMAIRGSALVGGAQRKKRVVRKRKAPARIPRMYI